MKKRGMYILLSGMVIFSSALYGGIREVKAAGDGEIQISAEILKVEVNGQEKEMNRDLYELDALQRKELASTDMITVKTPKEDAAGDLMNEFGVTGEQM